MSRRNLLQKQYCCLRQHQALGQLSVPKKRLIFVLFLTESEWQTAQRFLKIFSPFEASPDAFFLGGIQLK